MAFMIVNSAGQPIYELDLQGRKADDAARASQFILHAALDSVDASVWTTKETYLKVIERHQDQLVSAYVTAGGLRFLLLDGARSDATIIGFFTEAHELVVKLSLNPFYTPGSRITYKDFDTKMKALARRHLSYRGE